MPTKKRRVGFIPRSEVLDLINKISYESNLSCSKIINILVEEALDKRGLFNKNSNDATQENKYSIIKKDKETNKIINQEFNSSFKNKLLNKKNMTFKEVNEETLDNEIYSKFLMFLQFQERMKNSKT